MQKTKALVTAILLLALLAVPAFANTPGHHTVLLTWTPGTCSVQGTCTTNVYRGTTTGVCADGKTPAFTGIVGATFIDPNPPTGAVFYNVTNVDPGKGGESTCNGEVQVTVQPITTSPDSGLGAQVQ